MFNKGFKKNLQKQFNEEYSYEGNYTNFIDKLEANDSDFPKFNRRSYIRKVSLTFSLMTLLVIVLAISISGKIIANYGRTLQKEENQLILTEGEIGIIQGCCTVENINNNPIYYVATFNKAFVSIYRCSDDETFFYFIRISSTVNNIIVTLNNVEQTFSNGFYYLGTSSLANKGKDSIEITVIDSLNSDYTYSALV